MATLPSGLTKTIAGFSDLFSKRAWPLVQVLLAGAILSVGPRTVSAALRVMGMAEERQFQKYHRVLNRVKWSTLAASRRLDAALYDPALARAPARGRPRLKGARQPTLKETLAFDATF